MCGLFGWDLTTNKARNLIGIKRRVVLATVLGLSNDNRGGDSWGYADTETLETTRGLGDIVPQSAKIADLLGAMCHTRKATRGAISVKNCHPFDMGPILGAHNGAVFNYSELEKKYENRKDFEVDSQHIFAQIGEGREFSEVHGYGVIEFIRKDKIGRVYLARVSKSGDLAIWGLGKDSDNVFGIIWSSNKSHLERAVKAAGLDSPDIGVFEYEVKDHQAYYVEKGTLYVSKDEKYEFGTYSSTPVYTTGYGSGYQSTGFGGVTHAQPQPYTGWPSIDDDDDNSYMTRAMRTGVNVDKDGKVSVDESTPRTYLNKEFEDANDAANAPVIQISPSRGNHVVEGLSHTSVKMNENIKKLKSEIGMPFPDSNEWSRMSEYQKRMFIDCIKACSVVPMKNLLTEVRQLRSS